MLSESLGGFPTIATIQQCSLFRPPTFRPPHQPSFPADNGTASAVSDPPHTVLLYPSSTKRLSSLASHDDPLTMIWNCPICTPHSPLRAGRVSVRVKLCSSITAAGCLVCGLDGMLVVGRYRGQRANDNTAYLTVHRHRFHRQSTHSRGTAAATL